MTTTQATETAINLYNLLDAKGFIDTYPTAYDLLYKIYHGKKFTKRNKIDLSNMQSSDVRAMGYVPSQFLTPIKNSPQAIN